jgi:hypothetical protein
VCACGCYNRILYIDIVDRSKITLGIAHNVADIDWVIRQGDVRGEVYHRVGDYDVAYLNICLSSGNTGTDACWLVDVGIDIDDGMNNLDVFNSCRLAIVVSN